MTSVALFNDTGTIEANPGCELTVKGLKSLLVAPKTVSSPLGFCYELYRRPRRFFPSNIFSIYRRLHSDPEFLTADTVVINGEGTIHHEEKGAQILLIILFLSRLMDKKVSLVNCSIEGLSRINLFFLNRAHNIAVREAYSQQYLTSKGINASVILDCAFLNRFDLAAGRIPLDTGGQPLCLFTPGVLAEHQLDNARLLREQFHRIREKGYAPCYLQVQDKEEKDLAIWEELGGMVVRRADYRAADIFSILNQAELIISGRYHVIIFSIMVKKPFVAMETNTWKIRGLLETLDDRFGSNLACHCRDGSLAGFENDYRKIDLDAVRRQIVASYHDIDSDLFVAALPS